MHFPDLESERLKLSKIQSSDRGSIFQLFSDQTVVEHYDLAAFENIEQADDLIQLFQSRYDSKQGIRWAIRLKSSGDMIGTCGFNSWNQKMQSAVIGYDLMPTFWGNGYAVESVAKIIHEAFDNQLACGPVNRIQADTVPGNIASEAVLFRLGFREEGLRREAGFWKGCFHDLKCFGLLKSEYKA